MKFDSLEVGKPMLSRLEKHGITEPTTIQKEIIPAIKAGRDVLAQSETGSGKTLSFAIPIIEQAKRSDGLTTLVLVPTRELCIQVSGEFIKFSDGNHLGITSVYGGVSINGQARKMKKTNIIIATPGRLIDLLDRKALTLETINVLVLDEADRMLDMGFIVDIERILKRMPQKRQTLLFSATVSKEIEQLSMKYLDQPVLVSLESKVKPEFLQQTYYQTTPDKRMPLLIHLLASERDLALVFCNKKHVTAKLAKKLTSQGINAKCLHGDMSQPQRERVTAEFRNKKIDVLIATDVAARGLHIDDITHVYNYEVPRDVETYTHRVGRTARAGKTGEAISLVATDEDRKFFKQILFNYSGNISLKKVNPADIPEVEVSPREKARKEREDKQHDQDRSQRKKEQKQPHRDSEKEPHKEKGREQKPKHEKEQEAPKGKPYQRHQKDEKRYTQERGERRQRDEDKRHSDGGERRSKNTGSERSGNAPGRRDDRRDGRRDGRSDDRREGRRDDRRDDKREHKQNKPENLHSHNARHRERDEFKRSQRDKKGRTESNDSGFKKSSQYPSSRPRKRKPFEREADAIYSPRVDIPDMRREKPSSQQPDDKKKKKNWREMWERLIGG